MLISNISKKFFARKQHHKSEKWLYFQFHLKRCVVDELSLFNNLENDKFRPIMIFSIQSYPTKYCEYFQTQHDILNTFWQYFEYPQTYEWEISTKCEPLKKRNFDNIQNIIIIAQSCSSNLSVKRFSKCSQGAAYPLNWWCFGRRRK